MKRPKRIPTAGEELANSISHGVGALGMLIGAPFLIMGAVKHGGVLTVVAASIFAFTAFLLYLASSIYHGLPRGRAKDICEVIDHSAIYLLIAGTYTPFTFGVLRGPMGWTLFGLIWAMAVAGVYMKTRIGVARPIFSTSLYIVMGWLIVLAAKPLSQHVPLPGLIWLSAGGVTYTLGVVFYVAKRIPYGHLVWHVFVLGGTVCHYFAVLWYAAGSK